VDDKQAKLDELAQATVKLAQRRSYVDEQMRYRDRVVREALAAGATWAEVQEVAHLSPRGVALAVKRV